MPELYIREALEHGERGPRGNIVAIQPYMLATDYLSEGAFSLKVEGYLRAAAERGWLGERTLVALPEYLGTWLVALGEDSRVHRAGTVEEAVRGIVRAHPLAFARHWAAASAPDRARHAVFALKAEVMAAVYQRTFSTLARTYGVTIVAGSILLPAPRLEGGRLLPGRGALQNVAPTYRPDGHAVALSRKTFPTAPEQPFVAGAPAADSLPVINAGPGRLGVLVCADSWYPEAYAALRAGRAKIVVVVSYCAPEGCWDHPWGGYSGAPAPADVDGADVGALTERQAWCKYALLGRIAASGAGVGVNVFLRGRLWDLGSAGGTMVHRYGETLLAPEVDGATLVNVWL